MLTYAATDRKGYRSYKSNPEICSACPFLEQCTKSKNHQKVITRHVWEDDKEKVRQNRLSVSEKTSVKKRKNRAKLCRFKTAAWASLLQVGKQNVSEQVLLTAACQNMKKIAAYLAKACGSAFSAPEIK
ncbi:transposase [Bacillus amyloliquefaciens]|uniref:transposase n=1 Tax=Bacillus amyloliquefaciens TaxID=1390 RepID=UPI0009798C20